MVSTTKPSTRHKFGTTGSELLALMDDVQNMGIDQYTELPHVSPFPIGTTIEIRSYLCSISSLSLLGIEMSGSPQC